MLKIIKSSLPDVLIIEPDVFADDRGFFLESWNARKFASTLKINVEFVQDNHSRSKRGVLRGLHYQVQRPQGKLVRVVSGRVFDVAVDLRRSSPMFGRCAVTELSEDDHRQFWIPPGFAHGFLVLSESADVLYKTTDYYAPEYERCLIWNDPAISVPWPAGIKPLLSEKDRAGVLLAEAEIFP